jgi:hypothetical protein
MHQKPLFAWQHYSQDERRVGRTPIHSLPWRSIMEPWRELEEHRRTDPNFRHLPPAGLAQRLHFQIVGRVQGFFPDVSRAGEDDASWHFDRSGMFHLDFKFVQLTFKKLDADFQRSNAWTPHNDDYWINRVLDGTPSLIRLIAGYQWIYVGPRQGVQGLYAE